MEIILKIGRKIAKKLISNGRRSLRDARVRSENRDSVLETQITASGAIPIGSYADKTKKNTKEGKKALLQFSIYNNFRLKMAEMESVLRFRKWKKSAR